MNSEFSIAIHALVYLNRMNNMVSSERLAKSVCTNPARVRKVMARLKAAELVGAKEGAVGGYFMVKSPESITLDMLLDALNAQLIVPRMRTCTLDVPCDIASSMEGFLFDLCGQMNNICKEQLVMYSIADVDHRIQASSRIRPDETA